MRTEVPEKSEGFRIITIHAAQYRFTEPAENMINNVRIAEAQKEYSYRR